MTIETYLAFVAASILLILTPGPMVAFVVTTTLQKNLRAGLAAVAGSGVVSAIQLGIVALGLYSVMQIAGEMFSILKWLGVIYLLYLGIRSFFAEAPKTISNSDIKVGSYTRIFIEAMLVMATNPKAILFHAAFLPLFVSPTSPAGPQLAILAATFLTIGAVFDGLWALFAHRARGLVSRAGRWMNKISGGVLCAAGLGLALTKPN